MNPWNNPENSIKEMALAGRPEPYGQRKCLRLGSQSLAGLPSDRLPHRELPDLCAELGLLRKSPVYGGGGELVADEEPDHAGGGLVASLTRTIAAPGTRWRRN